MTVAAASECANRAHASYCTAQHRCWRGCRTAHVLMLRSAHQNVYFEARRQAAQQLGAYAEPDECSHTAVFNSGSEQHPARRPKQQQRQQQTLMPSRWLVGAN